MLVILSIVILLLIGGFAYQKIGERSDLKRYPPPGRMIDVGGRRLHLACARSGSGPTVIIEAGAGDDSNSWREVLDRVAGFAATCGYDRAGLGWSEVSPQDRGFADRAADLHELLDRASLRKPYILVGHSYGGYIVRTFAREHPFDIAGIVLVDASEEGFAFQASALRSTEKLRLRMLGLGVAAQFGVLRLIARLAQQKFKNIRGTRPAFYAGPAALHLRSSRYFETADEMAAYRKVPADMRQPGGFGSLADVPLTVISRGSHDPVTGEPTDPQWLEGQGRLLDLSTRSTHVIAHKSGHMIQDTEPDLIVGAILKMWTTLGRTG
jgi:pimeloyl-ACP methyl ester carboxylesterase